MPIDTIATMVSEVLPRPTVAATGEVVARLPDWRAGTLVVDVPYGQPVP